MSEGRRLRDGRWLHVLKLDVDWMPPDRGWVEEWRRAREVVLREVYGLEVDAFYVAPSERGFHAWIHVVSPRRLSDGEVNKLQFVLGDDATRCRINQWKIEAGVRGWNKLFSRVVWRRRSRYYVRCEYCGNVIPLVGFVREGEGCEGGGGEGG